MNTNETPATILAWGTATFGEPDLLGILVRANLEMAELVSAVSCEADREVIAMELADVDIVCSQAAAILGIDPNITDRDHVAVGPIVAAALVANVSLGDIMCRVMVQEHSEQLYDSFRELYWALRQLAIRCDVDMQERRNQKMAINRRRTWGKTPEGHFQHVTEVVE